MKYLNQSILIITIAALSICNSALAQTKPTQPATTEDGRKVILKSDGTWEYQLVPQSSSKTKESVNAFDTKSFNLKQEKLSTNYKGHNPELIFNVLQEWAVYKPARETMDSFRERLKETNQAGFPTDFNKKTGGMSLESVYAFQAEIFPEYDANAKIMKASFYVGTSWFRGQKGYLYSSNDKQTRSFIGQNAYGAQVTVKVIESESLEILAANGENFLMLDSKSSLEKIGVSFDIDAETAASVKTTLKALIICKLVEPYGKYNEDIIAPTISRPEQTEIKAKALVTEILEVWYYDPLSGKIYYKQKPK